LILISLVNVGYKTALKRKGVGLRLAELQTPEVSLLQCIYLQAIPSKVFF